MYNQAVLRQLGSLGLLVLGMGAVVWMVWTVGWEAIQENLSTIGWWFVILVGLFLVAQIFFFVGWWAVIDRKLLPPSPLRLFGIYLAGDAINYLITSGNLAGEPVKALLLRRSIGFGQAMTSITIHKHAELVAQWLFLVLGAFVALVYFDAPWTILGFTTIVVVGLGGGLMLLTRFLRTRTYGPIVEWVAQGKVWGTGLTKRLDGHRSEATSLDVRLQTFYRQERRSFFAAVGWCFLGWFGGVLETYAILRLLTPTGGWLMALSIESLSMAINNLFFFIPGRVGSAEGVRAWVCLAFGIPVSQGVALGLVRRGRELVWLVPGLLVLVMAQAGRLGHPHLAAPLRPGKES